MLRSTIAAAATAFLTVASVAPVAHAADPGPGQPVTSLPPMVSLDGSAFDPAALSGKVVLFVNVASKCGFTGQYEGLQALYAAHRDAGLVVVGVPCNQFGWQEPGSSGEIASFCRMTYGVDFPMLDKQSVNGKDRSPLYRWLVGSAVAGGSDVRWNFEKFLVGRDGLVRARFRSQEAPRGGALEAAVLAALAEPVQAPSTTAAIH